MVVECSAFVCDFEMLALVAVVETGSGKVVVPLAQKGTWRYLCEMLRGRA